jgi:F-type H+-transporting ATPase subunit a
MTENTAGKKWAKAIFPYFMTIVLVVLLANWMEMLPGVDSIGLLEPSEHGHAVQQLIPGVLSTISESEVEGDGAILIPFVRVASTDLNFTAALALISVVMTQVIGLRAQGPRYLLKFFNVTNLFKKPFLGVMDWLVSLLELISEFAKIVSFTFRLFGVMFSGMILIFLIGSMLPYFLPSFVYMFEFFMGLIQAMVFGLLTMVFMSMATQGHGEHEEAHA